MLAFLGWLLWSWVGYLGGGDTLLEILAVGAGGAVAAAAAFAHRS
jgi:hypothetical protein